MCTLRLLSTAAFANPSAAMSSQLSVAIVAYKTMGFGSSFSRGIAHAASFSAENMHRVLTKSRFAKQKINLEDTPAPATVHMRRATPWKVNRQSERGVRIRVTLTKIRRRFELRHCICR